MNTKQIFFPKFIVCKDANEIADKVAKIFINQLIKKPKSVFILPTGSTPINVYCKLVKSFQDQKTSWKDVTTFNLDEYLDLKKQYQDQSYLAFMKQNLFDHVDINWKNVHFPSQKTIGMAYANMIENANQADLTLLGIGTNGHIAFNEPGTPLDSETKVVKLDQSTREANSRFFDNNIDNVPTSAVSMGLKTIIDHSKKIILIATGKTKAQAIKTLKNAKEFDPNCPATALLMHPDVTIYLDDAASH